MTAPSARRPGAPPTLTRGQMLSTSTAMKNEVKKGNPDNNWGLGVAKVSNIDYEGFLVTLKTIVGTSQTFERVAVPMTFPGAGARHFFGAMPQIGDMCVIGWMIAESSKANEATKVPVILSWLVPGVWPGHDWLTTAEFEQDEHDATPGERTFMEGGYERTRHKLRQIAPGNIVASSAQGADLVLDEGVSLASRRGNEIRLRDQDQAIILRSIQQFHAMAGSRIYAGMVQRDATFLPSTMISDGKEWDGLLQASGKVPVSDTVLTDSLNAPVNFLTPARILQRDSDGQGGLGQSFLPVDPYLDPYQFLQFGGFINSDGFVADQKSQADAVYGGKPLYRVMAQDPSNGVTYPNAKTLTEYRLEVSHDSDGTLPVTEQTDLFDADRSPDTDPSSAPAGLAQNAPFIEWVLGTVVGNDPFSQAGRTQYGIPLTAVIFNGNQPAPRLEPAIMALPGSGVSPTPLKNQLATLFRITPPEGEGQAAGTFWGVNKQGQFKGTIGGPENENSVELAVAGGLKISVGGHYDVRPNGHIEIGTKSHNSVNMYAEKGGVRIYGGGPVKTQEVSVEAVLGSGRGAGDSPAVDIEARTNMRLKAEKQVLVKGGEVVVEAATTRVFGHDGVEVSGTAVSITAESHTLSVGGKSVESYTGPKSFLPSNFPLHERIYSPQYPGVAEKVTYTQGDREEEFKLGSHNTHVVIGDMNYKLDAGTWKVEAVTSSLELGSDGITGVASLGAVSLTAQAGAASMTGLTSAELVATGGTATVRGLTGVYLGGPITATNFGAIVVSGSLEPFTGLPFATWAIGAPSHLVGL